MFGISMLLWGAIFSALISKVPLESVHGILFYILAPMIAVGTGVAYFIRRGNSRDSNRAVANALLEALPVGSTLDSEGGQK